MELKRTEQYSAAILMAVYEGKAFLNEQLDSFLAQQHKNFTLWASLDCECHETRQILENFSMKWNQGRCHIINGPKRGFAINFLSLLCNPVIQADYYAFSDQDDIWLPDKLSRAIAQLTAVPQGVPALYCGRTYLVDENNEIIGMSSQFKKTPSFANALVQSIGGGNTIIMNQVARQLLLEAGVQTIPSHDWWAYLVICGAGGVIIHDDEPSVRYRQHQNNLVGSNNISLLVRMKRLKLLIRGRFRDWISMNVHGLKQIHHLLTPENQQILDEFCQARDSWLLPRLWGICCSGVYRQTFMGNLGIIIAAILKKI